MPHSTHASLGGPSRRRRRRDDVEALIEGRDGTVCADAVTLC
eukprot:COSAG02_NODE_43071_length_378_cov_1.032258_1_plen_41_part_10